MLWSSHIATDSVLRGDFKGHAGVAEFFGKVGETIDIEKFEVEHVLAEGDLVAATLAERYTVKSTGKVHDGTLAHLFHFDSEGRIDRFDEWEDANDAWR